MVTIRQLLVYVTAIGLGLAAFLSPTPFVAAAAYSLSLTVVAANLIVALAARMPDRAYNLGFVVACSLYLYAANPANSRGFASGMEMLLTQRAFEVLEPYFVPHERVLVGTFGGGIGGSGGNQPPAKVYRTDDLIVLWHSLWAILVGECGGMMAYILKRRADRKD